MLKQEIADLLNRDDLSEQDLRYRLVALQNKYAGAGSRVIVSPSLAERVHVEVDEILNSNQKSNHVFSGWDELDELTGGFFPGELIVLGGRPGMGKTSFAIQQALNISRFAPVLYLGFGNDSHLLSRKVISYYSGVPIEKLMNGKLSEDEKKRVADVAQATGINKLFLHECISGNYLEIPEICRTYQKEFGIKFVVVDYLQLLIIDNIRRSRDSDITQMLRNFKYLALELGISILLISQLSRMVENRAFLKRPVLSDLRDSGSIESEADLVMFLYRQAYYGIYESMEGDPVHDLAELIIAKNRSGATGTVIFKHDKLLNHFEARSIERNGLNLPFERLHEFNPDGRL